MAHLAHYREAHPMPFVITHWINLVAMVLLIFTGFYIHYPFFWGFESMARGLHVFFGFVLFINCICRLIMAFIVKSSPTGGTANRLPTTRRGFRRRITCIRSAVDQVLSVLQEGSPAVR